ncbi:hypothetical protein KEJ19_07985 [Candidatus Bathyarchaeota archaeon]|nr:hypothetical protein [Candidatus Bathyarchaeota archaeon]
MDGAFDSAKTYRLLRSLGVKPLIKPRRNAREDGSPPERRRAGQSGLSEGLAMKGGRCDGLR